MKKTIVLILTMFLLQSCNTVKNVESSDDFVTVRIQGCDYIAQTMLGSVELKTLTLKGNGNCGCDKK